VLGHAGIIVHRVRARFEGLGRRLLAYIAIVIALLILLRVVVGVVIGFVHTLILVALLIFALYALSWGMRTKDST
jgi:hypothetical protein